MLYGEPRVTHDIDFIILLRTQDIVLLTEAYPAPDFYVPPREVITSEVMREGRGQFNVIHSASALKADFHTAKRDELQLWAFRNGRNYLFGETPVRLAPPEYVIVRKLDFREGGSEKHLRDIRSMLKVSGDQIDRAVLNGWIGRQKVEEQWQRVLADQ